MWTRRATLIYPVASFDNDRKDAVANAFVLAGLETFANERLMFDKAAPVLTDYGLTQTHAAISSQLTPAVASALVTALSGVSGLWYLLDAETGDLIETNDPAKTGGKGLQWEPDIDVIAPEVLEYQGALYEVITSHTTQIDWPPADTGQYKAARTLFRRYRAPGEVTEWVQPIGSVDAFPPGARVTHNDKTWRNGLEIPNVWEPGTFQSGWIDESAPQVGEWSGAGVQYIGFLNDPANASFVTRNGNVYRCQQTHVSQPAWAPDAPGMTAIWILAP